MRLMRRASLISHCFDAVREQRAQATVEAALLLPSFCIVVLLSLQPACVLYTQAMMEVAATQACRLVAVGEHVDEGAVKGYALRRLAAIPDASIFHAGGPLSWEIEYGDDGEGAAYVEVRGWVRPFPVIGAFVGAFGERNGSGDMRLRVRATLDGRPSWLKGGYDDWMQERAD